MIDFGNPAADGYYASLLRRPLRNGYDGWMEDYGEYVPPDSVSANGRSGQTHAQPLPGALPPLGLALCPGPAAAAGALRPLGLDRRAPVRPGGVGRRPHHRLGLRRPALLGNPGAHHGPVRHLALGLGHRRVLHPRRQAPHPRAAHPLAAVRRGVGGDADQGRGHRNGTGPAPPDLAAQDAAPLPALGQAAHPALPLPGGGRRRVPAERPAHDAPPGPRLSGRPARCGDRRRVPVRPRPAGRARNPPGRSAAARSTCRAGAGSTSGVRWTTAPEAAACGWGGSACCPAGAA